MSNFWGAVQFLPTTVTARTYGGSRNLMATGGWRRLATSKLGGYGSPLAWAPGKGPTRGGRHPAGGTRRSGPRVQS